MTYDEAKRLIENNPLKHFGVLGTPGPIYDIHFKIITPKSKFSTVKSTMSENGGNNKIALIDLGLFNEDLRVIIGSELPDGNYVKEDLYNYLLDTGQLR